LAAGEGSRLVLTTQAAERAYRAAHGVARMTSEVTVAPGGRLDWLPQELILFEGAALERRFTADLSGDAGLLLVEPVIFGRLAMGEALRAARFRDRIEIRRDGMPLYNDALRLEGDIFAYLDRAAVAGGARAMASLVYVGADAEGLLPFVRSTLPGTGGASLLRPDLLVARVVAPDGFALRKTLLPALDRLSRDALPTSWRL
jgi:urease accessory protein